MIGIIVLVVATLLAMAVGLVLRRRSGAVRPVDDDSGSEDLRPLLLDAGTTADAATVLHFSADWCGPCAAVRTVVSRALDGRSGVRDVELDIDAHPALVRGLNVLSLPTTFVLDADLRVRARIAGVPSVSALRSALDAL